MSIVHRAALIQYSTEGKFFTNAFCVFLLKRELAGLCIQALVRYDVFTREHV